MYMPCASFIKVMADSPKQICLFHYFSTSGKTKEIQRKWKKESNVCEKETEEELSAIALANKKTRTAAECTKLKQNTQIQKFQMQWKNGHLWLNYSEDAKSMTCSYCIDYNNWKSHVIYPVPIELNTTLCHVLVSDKHFLINNVYYQFWLSVHL